jgi:hypothetical protein
MHMATEEISAEGENGNTPTDALSFGIEEEYFLVHRDTRDLVREEQPKLMAALKSALGDQVCGEFLCSQIEIGTRVCHSPTMRDPNWRVSGGPSSNWQALTACR